MEHSALKLIRESTDFVNLVNESFAPSLIDDLQCIEQVVRRRKHPVMVSDFQPPVKYTLNKTRKDERFGIVLGCRYFIKKIHFTTNDMLTHLQEGDEIIKVI